MSEERSPLEEQVAGLQATIEALTQRLEPQQPQSRFTQKAREHEAFLREFIDETGKEDKAWIITRVSKIREKRDPDQVKRFISTCNLDLINPETGDTKTIEANWLETLQTARQVRAKIVKHETKQHITETYGTRYEQTVVTETAAENNYKFEVLSETHTYTLEILDGEFAGQQLVTGEEALNI